jgi:Lsr2
VREWARARGLKVSERGRIPADVAAEYEKSHA